MASDLKSLHKKLLTEWGKEGNRNLKTIGEILTQTKAALFDPKALSELDDQAAITIHRDVFEIDALLTVLAGDVDSFEEAMKKVNKFYESMPDESPNKYQMIGLDLMHLLASSRLSEFHMVLETVDQKLQATNPYISMPVKLEQYLMEGAYNKVVLTEKNMPSPFYMVFVKIMLDTVRKEIAQCVEKSFKRIAVPEAARMLLFTSASEANEYGKRRGWTLVGDHFIFEDANVNSSHQPKFVETDRLAKQNIYYAKQLEMIV